MISSEIFGSNAIKTIPKNDVNINIHFLKLIVSLRNTELKIIAKGIDNWAPIVTGAKIEAKSKDKYKNIFTPAPMHIEKPRSGRKYFLLGIVILQKGIKHKKTIPILKAPNKIGLRDAFNPNLPKGYALPKKNITKTIKPVCFGDKFYLIEKGSSVGSSEV